jgi:HD-like signal output (HDOD) protein/CheY-like chemotaxis protein
MKGIIFVDDEPRVLQGLQRLLRGFRNEWQMEFVESGQQALDRIAQVPFDVVVTDLIMPGIDGAQLLSEIKQRYPHMVRIVLSGNSDREAVLRLVGPAHQYLSKPCDADLLKETIARAFALRDLLANGNLRQVVSQMGTLPSVPNLYLELMQVLRAQEPPIEKIGEIISKDLAMSAKILQMVNSAFFGLPQAMANPTEATIYLGVEIVKALVLSIKAFSQFEQTKVKSFSLDHIWHHSWRVGLWARWIAMAERQEQKVRYQCFSGGLLHDIGKLVLASGLPAAFQAAMDRAQQDQIPVWQAEQETFGASHAEVGAYLLGLWGLQNPVVEAVALHHRPAQSLNQTFGPLTTVHVANALEHEMRLHSTEGPEAQVARDYLGALGLSERWEFWRSELKEREECL